MSIDAIVGRIDQIMVMQQRLADPAAAAAQSTSGATAAGSLPTTTGTSAAGTPASFSAALQSAIGASAIGTDPTSADPTSTDPTSANTSGALNSALATAIPGLTTVTPGLSTAMTGATGATGSAAAQVQAMTNMANSLVGKPYVIGGGHSGWGPQPGYDCSGFVSAVLHAGGYLSQPVDTTAMPQQAGMESGPGQYVTVYDRAQPGQSGHVIIEINGQFYESGGSHGAWGGGGGVEKIGTPSAAYLAQFPNVLHPSGL
jgi:cell wall-associated NlpC family hydrolase